MEDKPRPVKASWPDLGPPDSGQYVQASWHHDPHAPPGTGESPAASIPTPGTQFQGTAEPLPGRERSGNMVKTAKAMMGSSSSPAQRHPTDFLPCLLACQGMLGEAKPQSVLPGAGPSKAAPWEAPPAESEMQVQQRRAQRRLGSGLQVRPEGLSLARLPL